MPDTAYSEQFRDLLAKLFRQLSKIKNKKNIVSTRDKLLALCSVRVIRIKSALRLDRLDANNAPLSPPPPPSNRPAEMRVD